MVIMMANTLKLTPEPQDFPPVALTSLLELTSNVTEGAHHTTDLAIDLTVAMTTISMSIGIFKQFIQDYNQQAPHTLGHSQSPLTPTQSEFNLNKQNYKLVLALEHMQYIQEQMINMDPMYLRQHISMVQQMKFHSMTRTATLPAVHLDRMTQTTYTTPLMSQLFNLWQACLTTSLSMRPTNILSYQIHQQFPTHTILQLFVESSLTISIPRELVEVPHENFIVQPLWLFCCSCQLTLKHMFSFMKFLSRYLFLLSRALYASLLFQI